MNIILGFILYILDLLNKNIGVVTIIVGFYAIYLYRKQKVDHKRDSARLILQEIRYAEQKIRDYRKNGNYQLYERLLPTNSWSANIHLFIKELKEVQNLDLISDFYAKSSYIDYVIATISKHRNNPKPKNPAVLPQIVTPSNPNVQPTGGLPNFIPSQNIKIPIIMQPFPQQILQDVSMNVEFIYNTPVVEMLRKISEKKWYQLF